MNKDKTLELALKKARRPDEIVRIRAQIEARKNQISSDSTASKINPVQNRQGTPDTLSILDSNIPIPNPSNPIKTDPLADSLRHGEHCPSKTLSELDSVHQEQRSNKTLSNSDKPGKAPAAGLTSHTVQDEQCSVGGFLAVWKAMSDLRFRPPSETIESEEWRRSAVHALLDPFTQFAEIPAGKSRMGSEGDPTRPNFDPMRFDRENPTWVKLGKDHIHMRIQRTSVTQLLWVLVMRNNPSYFEEHAHCVEDHMVIERIPLCPRNPVERVSWNEIAEKERDENGRETGNYRKGTFLRTLKDQFGIEARLPTEAEWERAARGAATQDLSLLDESLS